MAFMCGGLEEAAALSRRVQRLKRRLREVAALEAKAAASVWLSRPQLQKIARRPELEGELRSLRLIAKKELPAAPVGQVVRRAAFSTTAFRVPAPVEGPADRALEPVAATGFGAEASELPFAAETACSRSGEAPAGAVSEQVCLTCRSSTKDTAVPSDAPTGPGSRTDSVAETEWERDAAAPGSFLVLGAALATGEARRLMSIPSSPARHTLGSEQPEFDEAPPQHQNVEVCIGQVATTFEVPPHLRLLRGVNAGAYGSVAAFENTKTGQRVAVKKVPRVLAHIQDALRSLRELRVLRCARHRNLVRMECAFLAGGPDSIRDLYIVQELAEMDLSAVLRSKAVLPEERIQAMAGGILRGLAFLHDVAGVLHRDLKPANVLVNEDSVRICDFNLSRGCTPASARRGRPVAAMRWGTDPDLSEYVCTRWYRAPEVTLLRGQYGPPIDIWGAGCILGEMFKRSPLFRGKDALHHVRIIAESLGVPPSEELPRRRLLVPGAARLLDSLEGQSSRPWHEVLSREVPEQALAAIEGMLRFSAATRLTASQCLELPYFKEKDAAEPVLTYSGHRAAVDWSFDEEADRLTKKQLQEMLLGECH